MKKMVCLVCAFVGINIVAQTKKTMLTIGANWNEPIYSNTVNTVFSKKDEGKTRITYFNVYFALPIIHKNKINWNMGLSWKKLTYRYIDRVTSITYKTSSTTNTHFYQDPADLVSKSSSLGLYNDASFQLKERPRSKNSIGIANELCFYEAYSSKYESDDNFEYDTGNNNYQNYEITSQQNSLPREFFFSYLSTQLYYKITLVNQSKFEPALKISLGTNLYSDWDQFKRYAWVGVGAEISIRTHKKL